MGRTHDHHEKKQAYHAQLKALQIGLSQMQRQLIKEQRKLLVIFEGRDAAGKDGTIKRLTEHMSPRDTRVVALGVPSEHDRKTWYFQRWVRHLPVSGEVAVFNRSWYNRAGVERVMGFCSDAEYQEFLSTVPIFEQLLVHAGLQVVKYYLDVSKHEQKARLRDRRKDPLKQWKTSPIDSRAIKKWDDYTAARDTMLARTHSVFAPWTVVRGDDKQAARLAVIRDLLSRCDPQAAKDLPPPDPAVVFVYDPIAHAQGWRAE
jgi:polyphosphate kinase 2